jgi:uncharacterized protein YpmS
MRKWIKSLMLLAALFLVTILAVIYGGFRMFKGAPDWYRRSVMSPARREVLARRAFNKFADIQNAAALARQNQMTASSNDPSSPSAPLVVSFSDDELNAFFEKWANYANWKANYERYVEDPIIFIQDHHIIIAGRVNDLDAVVSLQFAPRIDGAGKLDLDLERVLAGRLPLPDLVVDPYKDRLTATLRADLPRWRSQAAIDADGAANSQLISAAMARLFIHTMDHTPADAILFLPLVERHANVPVRICQISISDHNVTMTVLPLDAKGREPVLESIKRKDER